MAHYIQEIRIPAWLSDRITYYLGSPTGDDHQHEDDPIILTTVFPDGMVADVKCCGVSHDAEDDYSSWSEMVLFEPGATGLLCEADCIGPYDEFLGSWEMEYGDSTYEVVVTVL